MSMKYKGFTIVELLIVIVVIAILAAIGIVAYSGIQGRAHASAVQNDLRQLGTQYELFRVDEGRYPNTSNELTGLNWSATRGSYAATTDHHNLVPCYIDEGDNFVVIAASTGGEKYLLTPNGVSEYSGPLTEDWTGDCSAALSGSSVISGGMGRHANGGWRAWTQ